MITDNLSNENNCKNDYQLNFEDCVCVKSSDYFIKKSSIKNNENINEKINKYFQNFHFKSIPFLINL